MMRFPVAEPMKNRQIVIPPSPLSSTIAVSYQGEMTAKSQQNLNEKVVTFRMSMSAKVAFDLRVLLTILGLWT